MAKNFFKMGRVYAGPEPGNNKSKKDFEMHDVYAGPEQMGKVSPRDADLRAVYAAPEVMERLRASDTPQVNMGLGTMYPFNNMSQDNQKMALVYAAPGFFPGEQGNAEGSAKVTREIIVCPFCGEKTQKGNFCENCGNCLKGKV